MENKTTEVVDFFVFLGSIIYKNGRSDNEIIRRMCKYALKRMDKILKDKDISIISYKENYRIRFFTVFLYGSKSQTVRKENRCLKPFNDEPAQTRHGAVLRVRPNPT